MKGRVKQNSLLNNMSSLLITNALLVNEGEKKEVDIYVRSGRIEKIAGQIEKDADRVIDAGGKILMPGMIDDQVHFRDPGFPEKGSIYTESRAAIAGGVTSFMDMPNTNPQTTTNAALDEKRAAATGKAWANFGFYLGATNTNLEEVKKVDAHKACGIKVFMGASTGNMLVDEPETLRGIFKSAPLLVATHCEDTPMITQKEKEYREKYGEDMAMRYHAEIRSREACYQSSSMAVELAKEFNTRLHVLHLTTEEELALFTKGPLKDKRITLEACVHHLFFSEDDYDTLGAKIKWNPSIKKASDRAALQQAVLDDIIDVIATDHAPHSLKSKSGSYWTAPSGGPLVQHVLLALMELFHDGVFPLAKIVQKVCHAPADLFQVKERGYIREGYWADLVLLDPEGKSPVTKKNIAYHCGWSPFENFTFRSSIDTTIVNGEVMFSKGNFSEFKGGLPLEYNR